MKSLVFALIIFVFTGCGSSKSTKADEQLSTTSLVQELDTSTKDEQLDKKSNKISRTLTIYVHGYNPNGEKSKGVAGDDIHSKAIDEIIQMSGFSATNNFKESGNENIIATTTYYGDQTPSYYTPRDIEELQNTKKGIPRYSLIIAKFAKHMLKETNATQLNIVSASMGSLITRYLIEKDLEHLASSKIIQKWLSLEGVIAGNIAASDKSLVELLKSLQDQPTEVDQMKYSWVEKQFGDKYTTNSSYMKDIEIAFESSTNDHLNRDLITIFTKEPNDGVQAVRDTYFHADYMHSYFYQTHTSLENSKAPWAFAVTFLTSKRRVKITLLRASLSNLHEDRLVFKSILPAEVVFESRVYSKKAMDKWGFDTPIDERVYKSHYLKVYDYKKSDEAKELDQILFDSKVLDSEDELRIKVKPYEIDRDRLYKVHEITGHGDKESLEESEVTVPIKDGEYEIRSDEWSGVLKVEVL